MTKLFYAAQKKYNDLIKELGLVKVNVAVPNTKEARESIHKSAKRLRIKADRKLPRD